MRMLTIINRTVDVVICGLAIMMIAVSGYAVYDGIQVQQSADIPEDIVEMAENEKDDLLEHLQSESDAVIG